MPRPSVNRGFSDTLLVAVLVMATVVALAIGLASDARGELIGNYDLTQGTQLLSEQNLASGPNALGDLTFLPGNATSTFNGTGWNWSGATQNPGAGVSVGVPSNFGNFTIGLRFSLGQVNDYRRIILFDAADDQGMYAFNGVFRAITGSFPQGGTISANTTVDFVLTRSSSGLRPVTGYQIDSSGPTPVATPIFNFDDTSNFFVSTGNVTQFFRDNTGGTEYSSSGTVSLIKIWNEPLSAGEIPYAMVPEPATVALLAVAGGGAMLYLHRRRRRLR